jgi:hypothetical protein
MIEDTMPFRHADCTTARYRIKNRNNLIEKKAFLFFGAECGKFYDSISSRLERID